MNPDTTNWTDQEIDLLKEHLEGNTIVVNMARKGHPHLVSWAKTEGVFTRIDRRTKWGNRHPLNRRATDPDAERHRVIAAYRNDLHNDPQLLGDIHELRGKVLGCWCHPLDCHGDVLIEETEP